MGVLIAVDFGFCVIRRFGRHGDGFALTSCIAGIRCQAHPSSQCQSCKGEARTPRYNRSSKNDAEGAFLLTAPNAEANSSSVALHCCIKINSEPAASARETAASELLELSQMLEVEKSFRHVLPAHGHFFDDHVGIRVSTSQDRFDKGLGRVELSCPNLSLKAALSHDISIFRTIHSDNARCEMCPNYIWSTAGNITNEKHRGGSSHFASLEYALYHQTKSSGKFSRRKPLAVDSSFRRSAHIGILISAFL